MRACQRPNAWQRCHENIGCGCAMCKTAIHAVSSGAGVLGSLEDCSPARVGLPAFCLLQLAVRGAQDIAFGTTNAQRACQKGLLHLPFVAERRGHRLRSLAGLAARVLKRSCRAVRGSGGQHSLVARRRARVSSESTAGWANTFASANGANCGMKWRVNGIRARVGPRRHCGELTVRAGPG